MRMVNHSGNFYFIAAPTSITGKPPRAKSVGAEQAVKDGVTTESDKPLVTTPMPMPRRLPPSGSRTLSSKVAPKEKNKVLLEMLKYISNRFGFAFTLK